MPILMLGCGVLASQYYQKPSFWEEQKVESEQDEEETDTLDSFEPLTDKTLQEVMSNDESKFVFFYDSEKTDIDYLRSINSHGNKMAAGLDCKWYSIDTSKYKDALKEYLRNRGGSKDQEKQIDDNNFILANRFDDVSVFLLFF